VNSQGHDAAGPDAIRIIQIFSVSRFHEDHATLDRIFGDSETTLYPNCRVGLIRLTEPGNVRLLLRGAKVPVVICDEENWRQLARELQAVPEAPCLILASESADDRLCTEAVKHGVYDVLAKPFRNSEVLRVIRMAWLHWQNRYGIPSAPSARGTGEQPSLVENQNPDVPQSGTVHRTED
jgi:hypothetical protein